MERIEPNESIRGVEFGMEALAAAAAAGPDALRTAILELPPLYETWIAAQEARIGAIHGPHRQATTRRLIAAARNARDRMADGIALMHADTHAGFYRAVEATSVTPWAARALDRALAAVVVATARHLAPDLTPDDAVARLKQNPTARAEVVQTILARAPASEVVGGHTALRAVVDGLLDAWEALADDAIANGGKFFYGYPRERALLHDPLDPLLASLDPRFSRFKAGRSMRDVEHASLLKILDPQGNPLSS